MNHDKIDNQWVIHLRQTLDTASQHADDFDETLATLAKKAAISRQEKLRKTMTSKTKSWVMGSLVIAASVSFAILPPIFTTPKQQANMSASQTLNNLTVASVDPQLLEDLEMVATLGDDNEN